MAMIRQMIWLSYDLGVRGDYTSLYAWLDGKNAKECGDSLAVLHYNFKDTPIKELKKELQKAIEITKRTRIYAVYRNPKTNLNKGSFIFGGRRAAPWSGYGGDGTESDDEEA